MEFSDKLDKAMNEAGVVIEGQIDWRDCEFQRFRAKGHYSNKKHLFVILLNGGASFGDWRDPGTWKTIWERSYRDLSLEEKSARVRDMEKLKREKELLQSHAIWRAYEMLKHRTFRGDTCKEIIPGNKYVLDKNIIPYYAKQIRSYIILPVCDINRNLQSLQYIKPNGFKQFKKNASPKEGMVWLTEPLPKDYAGLIRICEGYATGCSIYESVGAPVICALSASNLVHVALLFRQRYVYARLHICADNDYLTKENAGLTFGRKAAELTGSTLSYPLFKESDLEKKPSDFNDLFCLYGIEETEKQLFTIRK